MAAVKPGDVRTFDAQIVDDDGRVVLRAKLIYRIDDCRTEDGGATLVLAATPLRIVFMPPELSEEE